MHLHLDFETRSRRDLKEVGLDRYAREAEVLMLGWAVDDGPVEIWEPRMSVGADLGTFPVALASLLGREDVTLVSFNAPFERAIFQYALGFATPASRWLDPGVLARYASITGPLALVSKVLCLEGDAKDAAGKKLINMFCKPQKTGKLKGQFRDWNTNPEDWAKFREYCRQDVVAERAVLRKLQGRFDLPAKERKIWLLDQKINNVGMPVDRVFVENAARAAAEEKAKLTAEFKALTGLENPNSRNQLLGWLAPRGYRFGSLGARFVNRALAGECEEEEARDTITDTFGQEATNEHR